MCKYQIEYPGYAPGCRLAEALYTVKILSGISSSAISVDALEALIQAREFLQGVKEGRPSAAADGLSVLKNNFHYTACELESAGDCSHKA